MRTGHVWESHCHECGHTDGSTAVYAEEAPHQSPPACAWCLSPHTVWAHSYLPPMGPTFIVSRPEIPPHYNPAFGCEVESRAHLEHLQRLTGCEDADMDTGAARRGGVPSFVPTDADRVTVSEHPDTERLSEEAGGEGSAYEQVKGDYLELTGGDEKRAEELTERTLKSVPGAA